MKKFIFILTLLFYTNAFAVSGNDLYELMNSGSKLAALKYIQGLVDMQTYIKNSDRLISIKSDKKFEPSLYICQPEGTTYGQIYDIMNKYLSDHPETRHQDAANLLFGALSNIWQCKL